MEIKETCQVTGTLDVGLEPGPDKRVARKDTTGPLGQEERGRGRREECCSQAAVREADRGAAVGGQEKGPGPRRHGEESLEAKGHTLSLTDR